MRTATQQVEHNPSSHALAMALACRERANSAPDYRRIMKKLWNFLRRNHQPLTAICAIVTVLGGLVALGYHALGIPDAIKGIQRLQRDLIEQTNEFSLRNEIRRANGQTELLRQELYKLIRTLHSGESAQIDDIKSDFDRRMEVASIMYPPAPSTLATIGPSMYPPKRDTQWAITIPEGSGLKSVTVRSPIDGELVARGVDEKGLNTIAIRTKSGFTVELEHLTTLAKGVVPGYLVRREEGLSEVKPSSAACLRIGLRNPEGRYIDPRPYLPAMKDSVPDDNRKGLPTPGALRPPR